MTKEQMFLIQVLADHINGRKTDNGAGLEWMELNHIAKKQQVSGILYSQCKSIINNPSVLSELQKSYA